MSKKNLPLTVKKKKKILSALQCYTTKELEPGMDEHDHYVECHRKEAKSS
jgi:hypothetical protein